MILPWHPVVLQASVPTQKVPPQCSHFCQGRGVTCIQTQLRFASRNPSCLQGNLPHPPLTSCVMWALIIGSSYWILGCLFLSYQELLKNRDHIHFWSFSVSKTVKTHLVEKEPVFPEYCGSVLATPLITLPTGTASLWLSCHAPAPWGHTYKLTAFKTMSSISRR